MKSFLIDRLKKKAVVALVGGSDLAKMQEQMGGDDGEDLASVVQAQTDRHTHVLYGICNAARLEARWSACGHTH